MKTLIPAILCLAFGLLGCSKEGGESTSEATPRNPPEPATEWAFQSVVIRGSARFLGPTNRPRVLTDDSDPEFAKTWPDGLNDQSLLVGTDQSLQNVLVYILDAPRSLWGLPPTSPATMHHRRFMYEPRVQGVQIGQTLEITNDDFTTHTNHIFTRRQPESACLSRGTNPECLRFKEEEVFLLLACDQHPWEWGYVAVLPHPFFAVTDLRGTCQIPVTLPVGTYTLCAVHEFLGTQKKEFTVGSDTNVVDLSFEFKR